MDKNSATFDPSKLSPKAWYCGDLKTAVSYTMFQDIAGTVPANSFGVRLHNWHDISGNNHALLQETGDDSIGNIPWLEDVDPNRWIAFFGGYSTFGTLVVPFPNPQPLSISMVLQGYTFAGTGLPVGYYAGAAGGHLYIGPNAAGNEYIVNIGAGTISVPCNCSNWGVLQMVIKGNSSKVRFNNGGWVSGSLGKSNLNGIRLGGAVSDSQNDAGVRFAEVIVVPGAVSHDNFNNLLTYEQAKWPSILK